MKAICILYGTFTILNWKFNTIVTASGLTPLLRVKAGKGVPFLGLWDLQDISTGTDTEDIFRSGIIDNGFKAHCPVKFVMTFTTNMGTSFDIEFNGTPANTRIEDWLVSTAIKHPFSSNISQVLFPDKDTLFEIVRNGDPKKVFLSVYHQTNHNPYPMYLHVNTNSNPVHVSYGIEDHINEFNQAILLEIGGVYNVEAGVCDLTDYNKLTDICDVLSSFGIQGPSCPKYSNDITTESSTATTTEEQPTTYVETGSTDPSQKMSISDQSPPGPSLTSLMTSPKNTINTQDNTGMKSEITTVSGITTSDITPGTDLSLVTSTSKQTISDALSGSMATGPGTTKKQPTSTTIKTTTKPALFSPFFTPPTTRAAATCPLYISSQYKISETDDNLLKNGDEMWVRTNMSLIQCALGCNMNTENCKSFYFDIATNTCTGLRHLEKAQDKPTNSVHYQLVVTQPTSSPTQSTTEQMIWLG